MISFLPVRQVLTVMVVILLCLVIPAAAGAESDIKITVTNPLLKEGEKHEGTTVNTVLSAPRVSFGENRVLGTFRITGKKNIEIPVQPGNRIMVSLPWGLCYMQTPTAENYMNYVEWPKTLDGLKNQICDNNDEPGIKFISGTPRSITVEINNVDSSGKVMAIDFVYNKKNFSTVRVSRLNKVAQEYLEDPNGNVTRWEYFKLLADIILPFPSCPLALTDSEEQINQFSDAAHLDQRELNIIKPLVDSGIIEGYPGGLLKPDDYITRAQAVNLVGKIFPPTNQKADFTDTIPDWATSLHTAVANGIVQAYQDGTFKPNECIVKSEVVTLLQKTLESYSLYF